MQKVEQKGSEWKLTSKTERNDIPSTYLSCISPEFF